MLGRTNAFQNLQCPFFNNGLCERPYCHFKHDIQAKAQVGKDSRVSKSNHSTAPLVSDASSYGGYTATVNSSSYGYGGSYGAPGPSQIQQSHVPPPSFAPMMVQQHPPPAAIVQHEPPPEFFSGYTGYFASYNTADYCPATSAIRPGDDEPSSYASNVQAPVTDYVKPEKRGLLGDSPKKPTRPPPPVFNSPKIVPPDPVPLKEKPVPVKAKAEALNEMAKNISDIDRQIAEVKRRMEEPKFSSEEEDGYNPIAETERNWDGYNPIAKTGPETKKKVEPKKEKKSSFPKYTPTPISELEKKRKEKEERKAAKRLKEEPPKKSEKVKAEGEPKKKTRKAEQQGNGEESSKKSKMNKKSKASVEIQDIFGEDSEEEDSPLMQVPSSSKKNGEEPPKKKKKHKEKKSASEGKPDKVKKKPSEPKDTASDAPEQATKSILDLVPLGEKKRQAHEASHDPNWLREKAKVSGPRGHILTARETLNMRFKDLQKAKEEMLKRAAEKKANDTVAGTSKPSTSTGLNSHREGSLMATAPKGQKRTAHAPKFVQNAGTGPAKPQITPDLGAKIDAGTRQRYLNLMVDECIAIVAGLEEAYSMAVNEEKAVYVKSKSKSGYVSGAAHAIKKLRDERQRLASGGADTSNVHPSLAISHSKVLDGKGGKQCTVQRSGKPKVDSIFGRRKEFSPEQERFFYENLLPYVLSAEQLDENGFPRPNPAAPDVPLFRRPDSRMEVVEDNDLKRTCARCGRSYRLLESGDYALPEDCIYHPGKAWKRKGPTGFDQRFMCCQGDAQSAGCQLSPNHVSNAIRKSDFGGYVTTENGTTGQEDPRDHKIYALDCEMVYTIYGVALARVTVVNVSCDVVLDALVQPLHRVVDYNSRFSGLRSEDFEKADRVWTLEEVQAELLRMVTTETILMGHSLESDLRALKVIHQKVVDTSTVFPHRMGPPYKRALKTLVAEHLRKIIQEDIAGHDSKEDAAGCMELMLWKVREDLKAR